MNPPFPNLPPENDPEIRITALLLGELSEPEAESLRREIASSPELQTLQTQLARTLGLLREARSASAEQAGPPTEPLTLSADKRDRLLAAFKTLPLPVPQTKARLTIPWRDAAAVAAMLALLAGVTAVVLNHRIQSSATIGKPMASFFGLDALRRGEQGRLPENRVQTWEFRRSDKDEGLKQDERKRSWSEDRLAEGVANHVPPILEPSPPGFGGGLAGRVAGGPVESKSSGDFVAAPKTASASDTPLLAEEPAPPPLLNGIARFGDKSAGKSVTESLGDQPLPRNVSLGFEMRFPARPVTATNGSVVSDAAGTESLALQQAAAAYDNRPAMSAASPESNYSREGKLHITTNPAIEAYRKLEVLGARPSSPAAVLGQQPLKDPEASSQVIQGTQDRFIAKAAAVKLVDITDLESDKSRPRTLAELEADKKENQAGGRGSIGLARVKQQVQAGTALEGVPSTRTPLPAPPIPQPEVSTTASAFSTFSLNVSDVSFKLAAASLDKGAMPDAASIRSEEFINALEYHDPEPAPGMAIAFLAERARYPFAHDRDLVRFSVKTAAAGRQPGKPFNLVLAVDNSGSMERADRVRILQECLRALSTQFLPQDRISVVSFARTARLWIDGMPAGQAGNLAERIGRLNPEGGTNLEEAMALAYQTALRHYNPGGVNRVILITDGAANLGDVEPGSLKQRVEAHRRQGIALDCFGIGWDGLNDDLLEVLSRNGDGRYGFINTPEEAATEFAGQLAGALKIAASDVKVQVEWNPRRVLAYRQIGYARHQLTKEQFRDNKVDAAEIGAAEAGNALYTVQLNAAGEGPLGTFRVRYRIPGTSDYVEKAWTVPYTPTATALDQASPPLRLAGTAAAFSEWLSASPYAAEVTPDKLLAQLRGIPEMHPADPRPRQLETMIRQAKTISGK